MELPETRALRAPEADKSALEKPLTFADYTARLIGGIPVYRKIADGRGKLAKSAIAKNAHAHQFRKASIARHVVDHADAVRIAAEENHIAALQQA